VNPSIVMATVDRSPKSNYVHASIADLYAKDPTAPPMTWLLQEGWQQGGPAPSVWEVPAPLTA